LALANASGNGGEGGVDVVGVEREGTHAGTKVEVDERGETM